MPCHTKPCLSEHVILRSQLGGWVGTTHMGRNEGVIEVPRGGPGPGTQLLTGKYKVKTDQLFDDGLRFGKQLLLFRRISCAKKTLYVSQSRQRRNIEQKNIWTNRPPTPERFVQHKWRPGNIHNVYQRLCTF